MRVLPDQTFVLFVPPAVLHLCGALSRVVDGVNVAG
jgi:hypothetical protein